MTDYQNELVMEHLDLVNWVIRTRISVPNRPLLTYLNLVWRLMILVMKPSAMPFSSSTPVTRKLTVSSLLGMSMER